MTALKKIVIFVFISIAVLALCGCKSIPNPPTEAALKTDIMSKEWLAKYNDLEFVDLAIEKRWTDKESGEDLVYCNVTLNNEEKEIELECVMSYEYYDVGSWQLEDVTINLLDYKFLKYPDLREFEEELVDFWKFDEIKEALMPDEYHIKTFEADKPAQVVLNSVRISTPPFAYRAVDMDWIFYYDEVLNKWLLGHVDVYSKFHEEGMMAFEFSWGNRSDNISRLIDITMLSMKEDIVEYTLMAYHAYGEGDVFERENGYTYSDYGKIEMKKDDDELRAAIEEGIAEVNGRELTMSFYTQSINMKVPIFSEGEWVIEKLCWEGGYFMRDVNGDIAYSIWPGHEHYTY